MAATEDATTTVATPTTKTTVAAPHPPHHYYYETEEEEDTENVSSAENDFSAEEENDHLNPNASSFSPCVTPRSMSISEGTVATQPAAAFASPAALPQQHQGGITAIPAVFGRMMDRRFSCDSIGESSSGSGVAADASAAARSRSVCLANVPPSLADHELCAWCAAYGDVRTVDCSGRSHGYAVVTFFDLRSAAKALEGFNGLGENPAPVPLHVSYVLTPVNLHDGIFHGCLAIAGVTVDSERATKALSAFGDIYYMAPLQHTAAAQAAPQHATPPRAQERQASQTAVPAATPRAGEGAGAGANAGQPSQDAPAAHDGRKQSDSAPACDPSGEVGLPPSSPSSPSSDVAPLPERTVVVEYYSVLDAQSAWEALRGPEGKALGANLRVTHLLSGSNPIDAMGGTIGVGVSPPAGSPPLSPFRHPSHAHVSLGEAVHYGQPRPSAMSDSAPYYPPYYMMIPMGSPMAGGGLGVGMGAPPFWHPAHGHAAGMGVGWSGDPMSPPGVGVGINFAVPRDAVPHAHAPHAASGFAMGSPHAHSHPHAHGHAADGGHGVPLSPVQVPVPVPVDAHGGIPFASSHGRYHHGLGGMGGVGGVGGMTRHGAAYLAQGIPAVMPGAASPSSGSGRSHHSHSHSGSFRSGSSSGRHRHGHGHDGERGGDGRYSRSSSGKGGGGSDSARQAAVSEQFAFNVEEARKGSTDARTTVMIKNIPNKYNQEMLLRMLDRHFDGQYDFFYLPIDFKYRCNLGYAFVNFLSSTKAADFYNEFHCHKWSDFNSKKVCEVTYARVQGRQALLHHFRNSKFPCDDATCLPLVFEREENGGREGWSAGANTKAGNGGGHAKTRSTRAVPIDLAILTRRFSESSHGSPHSK